MTRRIRAACVVLVAAGVVVSPAQAFAAGVWATTSTPNPGPSFGGQHRVLRGVDALSSSNVWAVGSFAPSTSGTTATPLAIHWNGSSWSRLSLPVPANSNGEFNAVSAPATNDVWAVGTQGTNSSSPWVVRFNGSTWHAVSASTLPANLTISAVRAKSATNAWIGGYVASSPNHAVAAHWNGSTWSVTTFNPPNCSAINALSLVPGTSQVMAVGYDGTCGRGPEAVFARRWTGSKWVAATVPSADGQAFAVVALSATNAWLAGDQTTDNWNTSGLLLEQWNGSSWKLRQAPALPGSAGNIYSLAARSASNIMGVGWQYPACTGGTCPNQRTLAIHFNGTGWSRIATPNPATSATDGFDQFEGATVEPNTGAYWAVGNYGTFSGGSKTLAARYH
jgi:hypothetical protein